MADLETGARLGAYRLEERLGESGMGVAARSGTSTGADHGCRRGRGSPYLAVAFVRGQTLEARLASVGPLQLPDMVRVVAHVASGLDALHADGVVVVVLAAEEGRELELLDVTRELAHRASSFDFSGPRVLEMRTSPS